MFEVRDWNKFFRKENDSKNDKLHEEAEKEYGKRTHESMTRNTMANKDFFARSRSFFIGVMVISGYKYI